MVTRFEVDAAVSRNVIVAGVPTGATDIQMLDAPDIIAVTEGQSGFDHVTVSARHPDDSALCPPAPPDAFDTAPILGSGDAERTGFAGTCADLGEVVSTQCSAAALAASFSLSP